MASINLTTFDVVEFSSVADAVAVAAAVAVSCRELDLFNVSPRFWLCLRFPSRDVSKLFSSTSTVQ
jgi:hypothetical protein